MFSNVNYIIIEPYDRELLANSNVKIGVLKLSFVESVFDTDHLAGICERSYFRSEVSKNQFCL